MKSRLDPAVELLLFEMEHNSQYGEVVIKYEAGKVVLMKRTETLKPSSYRDIRGDEAVEVNRAPDQRNR